MFRDGLIRFSDKLQRNFSSGESGLIDFVSEIYKLVLTKTQLVYLLIAYH